MNGRVALLCFLCLLCPLVSGLALGEPYFAVQQGLKCAACHVNPSGGGMRNAFGNTWARTSLPARAIDLGVGEEWTGNLNRFVAVGANLRASGTYVDTPNQDSQSAFDVDEARLYLELTAIPDRLAIYLDQRVAPGGSSNLEAYGRYWFANRQWYVKAGQMYLPYGLRLEDDSAFIRQVPGINFDTPDRGVEVGLETAHWSAQFAATNGTAAGPEDDEGKQFSARVEFVQSVWRLGASYNFNDADVGERQLAGLFAGMRTGPIAWLAEADYVKDEGFAAGERNQWVGLLEANWLISQGNNLKITAEFFEPDDDVDEDEQDRYSAVWEYTPIQFLQLRLGVRIYDGIPQNDLQNRKLAFLQMNAFF
ncbi:hypothetical protein HNQ60_001477 [Povalibacter uvarum]|uniref:Cytochrome c domain-containing protein n=1 Tax=Povalibacter uvarum TaxID=732238 RepID=A0A841HJP0_9GAMM|nr:porin [Povalibacter uvarum]MBB6092599.1 hypothetical protein [Povalibacter uvarum]